MAARYLSPNLRRSRATQVDEIEIFYLERDEDPSSLRGVTVGGGFAGFVFEPVWSTDGSVHPVNILGL
jgi:hypothetical protein